MKQSILRKLALFAALSFVVHAYSQDMWDGINVASGFHAGTGTASNPFQVRTGAQLMYFVNQVNSGNTFAGKTIRLMNDIDLNKNGFSCSADFAGTFDGGLNDLRVKFSNAHSLFSSVRGTIKNLRLLASFPGDDGYPHYSSVYLVSTLHEGAVIKDCEYVIEGGYAYGYVTTYINTNYGVLQNCYTTGMYGSYGAGSYIRNGRIGMLVTNNMATGIVENCKGNTYRSGCNYEGTPLPLITNNQGTLIEGEYVSPFIIPTECTVEFIDTLYNQNFPAKIVNNGQTVGILPAARKNWTLTGWKRCGRIVCPTDTVKDNWTLFANWERVIRSQPTKTNMTVDVDDIDNALFQWYSLVEDTTHVEGWVSPKINDGEVTSKEISFDAESGQFLIIKYDLQSEADADYFKVYLNGVLVFSASGNEIGAIKIPVAITGANILKLSYTKDESWGSNRDNVIVSDIMIVNASQQVNCQTRTLPTELISSDSAYFCKISYTNPNTILYTDTIDFRDGMDNMSDTDISQMDNVIYIEPSEGFVGQQLPLSVKMKNTVGIQTVQFDLYLPDGVTVAKDEDDFDLIELSTERTTARKMDSFSSSQISNGAYRVLINSNNGYTFDGEDGEIAVVTVNISSDMPEGDYPIILKDIVLVNTSSEGFETEYVKSTLTVSDYSPGDVNGDGKVNAIDLNAIVNYILERRTFPFAFVEKAADLNGDGKINAIDVNTVTNMILRGTSPQSVKAPAPVFVGVLEEK